MATRLRIVGGEWRGRRLRAPAEIRPTQERVREALFSLFGPRVVDARGLDLFAGSGALGIEALSRGARWWGFVERSSGVARILRRNLESLGLDEERYGVLCAELPGVLRRLRSGWPRRFELIVADPPYLYPSLAQVAQLAAPLLAAGGWLVLEQARGGELAAVDGLAIRERRRYGDTELVVIERHSAE